jgi:hypothetical protein
MHDAGLHVRPDGALHMPSIKSRRRSSNRRRATQPVKVRPTGRHGAYESARRRPRSLHRRSDDTVRGTAVLTDGEATGRCVGSARLRPGVVSGIFGLTNAIRPIPAGHAGVPRGRRRRDRAPARGAGPSSGSRTRPTLTRQRRFARITQRRRQQIRPQRTLRLEAVALALADNARPRLATRVNHGLPASRGLVPARSGERPSGKRRLLPRRSSAGRSMQTGPIRASRTAPAT